MEWAQLGSLDAPWGPVVLRYPFTLLVPFCHIIIGLGKHTPTFRTKYLFCLLLYFRYPGAKMAAFCFCLPHFAFKPLPTPLPTKDPCFSSASPQILPVAVFSSQFFKIMTPLHLLEAITFWSGVNSPTAPTTPPNPPTHVFHPAMDRYLLKSAACFWGICFII